MVRCRNGHYYNELVYNNCPCCGVFLRDVTADSVPQEKDSEKKTVFHKMIEEEQKTIFKTGYDDIKTVNLFTVATGTRPVVGWLVCTSGTDKGCDYRLYAGNNFLGCGDDADIRIFNDPAVTIEEHTAIVYEPVQNDFFIVPGESTITQLNREPLLQPRGLKAYDTICVGATELSFIPYCTGGIHW